MPTMHGGNVQNSKNPLSEVSMRVGDCTYFVQAAVSDQLPVPVLLGHDVSGFDQLLGGNQCDGSAIATKIVAVTGRSQRRQEELSECERVAHEGGQGPYPTHWWRKRCPSVSWMMICLQRADGGQEAETREQPDVVPRSK